jgi:hypothetical protein
VKFQRAAEQNILHGIIRILMLHFLAELVLALLQNTSTNRKIHTAIYVTKLSKWKTTRTNDFSFGFLKSTLTNYFKISNLFVRILLRIKIL